MKTIVTSNATRKVFVKRTWKERLFSRPWNPFRSTKVVHKPAAFQCGDTIIIHPALQQQVRQNIRESDPFTGGFPFSSPDPHDTHES